MRQERASLRDVRGEARLRKNGRLVRGRGKTGDVPGRLPGGKRAAPFLGRLKHRTTCHAGREKGRQHSPSHAPESCSGLEARNRVEYAERRRTGSPVPEQQGRQGSLPNIVKASADDSARRRGGVSIRQAPAGKKLPLFAATTCRIPPGRAREGRNPLAFFHGGLRRVRRPRSGYCLAESLLCSFCDRNYLAIQEKTGGMTAAGEISPSIRLLKGF